MTGSTITKFKTLPIGEQYMVSHETLCLLVDCWQWLKVEAEQNLKIELPQSMNYEGIKKHMGKVNFEIWKGNPDEAENAIMSIVFFFLQTLRENDEAHTLSRPLKNFIASLAAHEYRFHGTGIQICKVFRDRGDIASTKA